MFIKEVIVQGFRSYRDQTPIEEFMPNCNVIVGRNGSGKSNFFAAIEFVLSDEFNNMKAERRQGLLHEGTGPRVLSAFVEIVFDNSDSRLPFDKDEVRLRRMIGAKKDQYFLDSKQVTRTDVQNLLESAGFSKSNPYYIVKQGQVDKLTTGSDKNRLDLLNEVAGTKVYDERKRESMDILRDTESKREKIENLLKYIEDRLKTLEEEKEELKEYQKWDKLRRSVEYTIYDQDLRMARKKLDVIQEKREQASAQASDMQTALLTASDGMNRTNRSLRELDRKLGALKDKREQLLSEQSEKFALKTQMDLDVKDIREELDGERSNRNRREDDLQSIKRKIAEKQQSLDEIRPKYDDLVSEEVKINTEMKIMEQQKNELYAKQGYGERFKSKEDRDTYLQRQIRQVERQIEETETQKSRLEQELESEAQREHNEQKRLLDASQELEEQKGSMEEISTRQRELKKQRDELQAKRTTLWQEERDSGADYAQLKDETRQLQAQLKSMAGKGIISGINSVNKVLGQMQEKGGSLQQVIDGYYGTLIENFTCDKKFFTAVEVTAGNRLFHHIVETDRIATKILEEINRQKLPGEVNFMPLNRLACRNPPELETQDAVPMINKLEFDSKYTVVMKHMFARTLICRNMDVATQLARSEHLDCVTLEGDQVGSRGQMTGGYYDKRRSRLELQTEIQVLEGRQEEAAQKIQKVKQELQTVEGEINRIVNELHKVDMQFNKARETYNKANEDRSKSARDRAANQRNKEAKERQLMQFEGSLKQLKHRKTDLQSELGTDLQSQLTNNEQTDLESIREREKELKQQGKKVAAERVKLETEKNKLENELQSKLYRKREELQSKISELSVEDQRQNLDRLQAELLNVGKRIKEVNASLHDTEDEIVNLEEKIAKQRQEYEDFQSAETEAQQKIDQDTKDMEKLAAKYNQLWDKKEDCMKKIRELGSLPADAFEKFHNLSNKQLFKKLEQCNHELKKYENVNKKALDQFVSFSEQKEKLLKRKDELDRGHKSIKDLMEALEHRKYEAIQLTFKQVSKYFEEVFTKLVPTGHAHLVMKTGAGGTGRDKDKSADDSVDRSLSDDDGETDPAMLLKNFSGIGIKAAFSGEGSDSETKEMKQLSGGQKSLIALALIFSIQKCDPAPFYLFDEIDAALDQQHRKSVADMIKELSENAQFIMTTFRPELLEAASRYYGVKFRHKVSHIESVTKEEAYDFVELETV